MQPVATYNVVPSLPASLQRLTDIAHNLRWTWDHETIGLFMRMDPDLWQTTHHNPVRMLGDIPQSKLETLAADDGFMAHLDRVTRSLDEYMSTPRTWYKQSYGEEPSPCIAYFSFEFGLTESVPNYSGGLGVLAGDHLKAASDLNVPLVGVGLLYQEGYFRQYLNVDGWQQELYPINDFYTMPIRLVADENGDPLRIGVDYPGRTVYAQIWQVTVGRVELYLLDTNIAENAAADQDITDRLYGGDREMRIRQEILLGIGGLRALHALGLEPAVCHMNEGHAAFQALERIRIVMERTGVTFREALAITSTSNVFTTHTPVPAGNDYFEPALIDRYFKDYAATLGLSIKELLALGRVNPNDNDEFFCMTILALRAATYNNGVSQLHGEVAREMWQSVYPRVPISEVPITAITNGTHIFSWIARDIALLFDRYLGPRWREDPTDTEIWARAAQIPDTELWRTHERLREHLVVFTRLRLVEQLKNRGAPPAEVKLGYEVLDSEVLTIGFARRFATYKRATMLLHEAERFNNLLCSDQPVQFVFAGKAHPHDNAGKEFIREIIHFARETNCRNRIVFLEDYDMVTARYLVQGVDVWLNTPRRPLEASGTSGMKAVVNGGINLSILDGWWAEAYKPDRGWAIGKGEIYQDAEEQDRIEADALFDVLEKDLIPTFYEREIGGLPRNWISRMKAGFRELAPFFNTARMVKDYATQFYVPALESARRFTANDYEQGRALAAWLRHLEDNWQAISIASVSSNFNSKVAVGERLQVSAEVYLGAIAPDDVTVQLYEGIIDSNGEIADGRTHEMHHLNGSDRGEGWYIYQAEYQSLRSGRHGYTVRAIPHHPDVDNVLRLGLVTWA